MNCRRRDHIRFLTAVLAVLVLLAGCARLPVRVPVAGEEQQRVADAFDRMRGAHRGCPAGLDAVATVTFKSWIQSGSLTGELQALAPGFFRFLALNPWGQPLLVLTTDGNRFRYLSVPEAKIYRGEVRAKAFAKYAPPGVEPKESFFWLTGRLAPGPWANPEIARDRENQDLYWLELRRGAEPVRHRLLFDPAALRIERHLLLGDRETLLLDVRYQNYQSLVQAAASACSLPGILTVRSSTQSGTLTLSLDDWQPALLAPADFLLVPPPGYEKVEVQ